MKKNTASTLGAEHHRYSFGQFVLDVDRGALQKGDSDIPLRPKCFGVLTYLVEHAGFLVTKDQIMTAVWPDSVVTEDSLTQCLIKIREALGDTRKVMLRTIPRRGFIFDVAVTNHQPGNTSDADGKPHSFLESRRPSRWSVMVATALALAIVASWWNTGSKIRETSQLVNTALDAELPNDEKAFIGESEAYEQYVKGMFFYNRRASGDIELAISHYQNALDLDPALADAWVGMAGAIRIQIVSEDVPALEGWAQMKFTLDKALELEPQNAELQVRLANYYWGIHDEESAQWHMDRALVLGQDSALVMGVASGQSIQRGDIAAAIEYQRRAAALDPLGFVNHGNLGHMLYLGGLYEESRREMAYASALNPENSDEADWMTALSWVLQQDCEKAYLLINELPDSSRKAHVMAMIHFAHNESDHVGVAVEYLLASNSIDASFYLAEIFAFRDEFDQSFTWLTAATDKMLAADPFLEDRYIFHRMLQSPFLRPLKADDRWSEWVDETKSRIKLGRSEKSWNTIAFEFRSQGNLWLKESPR